MSFSDDEFGRAAESNAIADFVYHMVDPQLVLLGPEVRTGDGFLRDDFSVGYVFGFADGVLQSRDIGAQEAQALAALSRTFQRFFGRDAGSSILGYCLKPQDKPDLENGKSAGLQDCSDLLLSKGKQVPQRLAQKHMG